MGRTWTTAGLSGGKGSCMDEEWTGRGWPASIAGLAVFCRLGAGLRRAPALSDDEGPCDPATGEAALLADLVEAAERRHEDRLLVVEAGGCADRPVRTAPCPQAPAIEAVLEHYERSIAQLEMIEAARWPQPELPRIVATHGMRPDRTPRLYSEFDETVLLVEGLRAN
jgi:hypothetical protein